MLMNGKHHVIKACAQFYYEPKMHNISITILVMQMGFFAQE